MQTTSFDSIVIGGGSGGLAFAQKAAELGANVLLIEHEDLGGTCVNRGCVPKKILWSAGQLHRAMVAAETVGVFGAPAFDMAVLAQRRDDHIAGLRTGFENSLDDAGVTLVRGTAQISGRSVTVDGSTYTATNIVIATGARPAIMDIEGASLLSDSRDVLSWTTLPASIAISGGGYIGCEFAAIFRALGVHVTLIHDEKTILETFPAALADHVQTGLQNAGIHLCLDDSLSAVHKAEGGLDYTTAGGQTGTAEAIVAAVGRTPNVDNLGEISEALVLASSGAIAVNDMLATNVPGVYALGDAADRMPLTPVATADGTALAHMLHGDGATLTDLDHMATTTFVYPPAAFVGQVDEEAARSGTFRPLSDDILTRADGRDPQMFRIGLDKDGTLTGAQIVAAHAEDLIALLAALRRAGGTATDLDRIIPVHPSFAEEFTGS
ncbi:dihydrolipoyl dehydrogenase family protein [Pseudooctadecabacter sp.]|uniref:dihydrolipoyl dehydrogenase family protein n=1 Tax=Pseudooctadecabacter sp. TaxID=1966338 RepID=UPI0025F6AEE4|nr:NAD(P)/FAD-dependent oxidoreductase [Pseudooctadecabacter sp.]